MKNEEIKVAAADTKAIEGPPSLHTEAQVDEQLQWLRNFEANIHGYRTGTIDSLRSLGLDRLADIIERGTRPEPPAPPEVIDQIVLEPGKTTILLVVAEEKSRRRASEHYLRRALSLVPGSNLIAIEIRKEDVGGSLPQLLTLPHVVKALRAHPDFVILPTGGCYAHSEEYIKTPKDMEERVRYLERAFWPGDILRVDESVWLRMESTPGRWKELVGPRASGLRLLDSWEVVAEIRGRPQRRAAHVEEEEEEPPPVRHPGVRYDADGKPELDALGRVVIRFGAGVVPGAEKPLRGTGDPCRYTEDDAP